MRFLVVACYALPAAAIWIVLGAALAVLPLTGVALVAAAAYGCYYGITELAGRRGLPTPGRRWQVPQSMMIGASPRRRLLAWGAILGPGFLTANPYAGFGVLPLAVAAMHEAGRGACLALAAVVGLAHGTARAAALLRDLGRVPPATATGQLDLLLKTVYWRRFDGAVLLALAAAAAAASVLYFLGGRMRIMKIPTVITACLTAVLMGGVTVAVAGFAADPAHTKRESLKIVNTMPGPRHGQVTAKGAFNAKGYFLRKRASLVFPKGRLAVRRHLLSTVVTPPNLATCWFKIKQRGTFRVFYATGEYRGLRYSGRFWTNISGRLKSSGPDQCGSTIVFYHTVTYEIGNVP